MIFKFVIGLVLLVGGAELLVRGASRLALRLGLPPLLIGLTIVAYGTSAPEMAVSAGAALSGTPGVALGNAVGSNIFNVLLILGLSALIRPLQVNRKVVRVEVPIMTVAAGVLWLLVLDGRLGRWDGLLLLAGMIVYSVFAVRAALAERDDRIPGESEAPPARGRSSLWLQAALVLGGLLLLVAGARWLVESSVAMARGLGLSELVVGLTLVAAGTSLPELATSVVAGLRKEQDIAVGNVVGSNIFNVAAVLGVAAVLAPGGLEIQENLLRFDLPFLLAVSLACIPIFTTGWRIARWEGGLFLGYYLLYTLHLVLRATHPELVPGLQAGLLASAGVLALITGAVVLVRRKKETV